MPAPATVSLAGASAMSTVGRLRGSIVPAALRPEPNLRRSRAALRAAIVSAVDAGASTTPLPATTAPLPAATAALPAATNGVRGSGGWLPSVEARLLPDPEVRFLPSLHVKKEKCWQS